MILIKKIINNDPEYNGPLPIEFEIKHTNLDIGYSAFFKKEMVCPNYTRWCIPTRDNKLDCYWLSNYLNEITNPIN